MQTKNSKFLGVILLMFILAILPFKINAQGLTLDQLISFQKKDISEVNDILISKGWSFSNSKKETTVEDGFTRWSYDKILGQGAQAWITKFFAENTSSRIGYQFVSKQDYLALKKSIISYGMKKLDSKVGDNYIMTYYVGKNYAVRIINVIKESDTDSYYIFTIYTKTDYNHMIINQ